MAQKTARAIRLHEAPAEARKIDISVIVPLFDEEGNVPLLCERLFGVLDGLSLSFEVIAVNDGSRDDTLAVLRGIALNRPELKIVDFRRNYGQTAAMMAGFDHASGEVIISIDADLQNDPEDIPLLLERLDQGYDVVSGWRRERKDAPIRRNLLSRVANRLISRVSGVKLNDYGCTLKAYRRDVIEDVRLYGEMHRFIPIYASWMGGKVGEIAVRHHPRQHGKSKYGLSRVFKVLLDLIVIQFLKSLFVKPIYIFGGFAMFGVASSLGFFVYMLYLKFFEGVSFILTPLPLLAAMTFLVGVVSLLMGLLAEMLVRIYFESQGRSPYLVRERINFDPRD